MARLSTTTLSLHTLVAAAVAGSLLLFAIPAYAAEVLINQAKAQKGGVTPADEPGFPVTLSRRGKYVLVSNLIVPSGQTGIEVTSTDVTIDLNGFSILNTQLGSRGLNGIVVVPSTLCCLTVMNGTIRRFVTGIKAPGGMSVIQNVTVMDNSQNGIEVGPYARVISNTVQNNGWVGILMGNSSRASQNVVAGNAITSGTAGLLCREQCLIEQNVVTGSVNGPGISMSTGGMVIGNVIAGNKGFGITADGSGAGFGNNTLMGNNNNGAQVSGVLRVHPNACQPASALCP